MPSAVKFSDVVSGPDQLMGVKAVWGRSREGVMCFGSRGNPALKDRGHFQLARNAAEYAQERPYLVTIGGGEHVSDELRGRTVELLRVTGAYGETSAFVRSADLMKRLAQWPVAVITSEVYAIEGEPLVKEDLGFPDRRILEQAYDRVKRDDDDLARLWSSLKDRTVTRRWDVGLPPGFKDPGAVRLCSSMYPTASKAEGEKAWKLALVAERDPTLKKLAKQLNRAANGGTICCETCDFIDADGKMFDAHHLRPIAAGERQSRVDDLAVLCPTCHRVAHAKAADKLQPLTLAEIRLWHASYVGKPVPQLGTASAPSLPAFPALLN